MITGLAVSVLLLHHHRRVAGRRAVNYDYAGALEQHRHIKILMEDVLSQEGPGREEAFTYFPLPRCARGCRGGVQAFPRHGGTCGRDPEVTQRVEEEEEASKAITELEQLGTASPEFPAKFEQFRQAVIAHAEAEEHEELPTLAKPLDDSEVARLQRALSLVPDLASRNGDTGTSFTERLQSARAEFRSGAPTAR
jgi:hypothetical protein